MRESSRWVLPHLTTLSTCLQLHIRSLLRHALPTRRDGRCLFAARHARYATGDSALFGASGRGWRVLSARQAAQHPPPSTRRTPCATAWGAATSSAAAVQRGLLRCGSGVLARPISPITGCIQRRAHAVPSIQSVSLLAAEAAGRSVAGGFKNPAVPIAPPHASARVWYAPRSMQPKRTPRPATWRSKWPQTNTASPDARASAQ